VIHTLKQYFIPNELYSVFYILKKMGLSKKKFKKGIKMTNDEIEDAVKAVTQPKSKQIENSELFTTNTEVGGLKKKREKLRADRFKEI